MLARRRGLMKKNNSFIALVLIVFVYFIFVGGKIQQEPYISGRVIHVIATQLNKDPNSIDLKAPLMGKILGADELDVIEIIMRLEDEFQIEIPDEYFIDKNAKNSVGIPQSLNTQKLIDIVNELLKAKTSR